MMNAAILFSLTSLLGAALTVATWLEGGASNTRGGALLFGDLVAFAVGAALVVRKRARSREEASWMVRSATTALGCAPFAVTALLLFVPSSPLTAALGLVPALVVVFVMAAGLGRLLPDGVRRILDMLS